MTRIIDKLPDGYLPLTGVLAKADRSELLSGYYLLAASGMGTDKDTRPPFVLAAFATPQGCHFNKLLQIAFTQALADSLSEMMLSGKDI